MDGDSVREAVDAMLEVLTPHAGSNWTVSAGPIEWSCRHTAAHVAHDLMAYAGQVAARPVGGYLSMDLTVRSDASVSDMLASVCERRLAVQRDRHQRTGGVCLGS